MTRYLPFIVLIPVLAALTAYQWYLMNWVWGGSMPAMQCACLLYSNVPNEIGDWVGRDIPVNERVRKLAGAEGYVNRVYRNKKTNKEVAIWFIVGHFRGVSRHTPQVCYKNAGLEQVGDILTYPIEVEDLPTASFFTAKFRAQDGGQERFERVYWAWWKPEPIAEGKSVDDVTIQWTNPESPRVAFGYCRALYKLYFTAPTTAEEKFDESVCLEFAQEFLPIADKAIRESGLVMVREELTDEQQDALDAMKASNEGETAKNEEDEEDEGDGVEEEAADEEAEDQAA